MKLILKIIAVISALGVAALGVVTFLDYKDSIN